jgi:hypothetical protein
VYSMMGTNDKTTYSLFEARINRWIESNVVKKCESCSEGPVLPPTTRPRLRGMRSVLRIFCRGTNKTRAEKLRPPENKENEWHVEAWPASPLPSCPLGRIIRGFRGAEPSNQQLSPFGLFVCFSLSFSFLCFFLP